MEDHAPSGTQAAALLRPTAAGGKDDFALERRRQEQQGRAANRDDRDASAARSDQTIRSERERLAREESEAARFGRPSALTAQHRLPVLETEQFRVVEPDGTEDPLASIDDGVMGEQPKAR